MRMPCQTVAKFSIVSACHGRPETVRFKQTANVGRTNLEPETQTMPNSSAVRRHAIHFAASLADHTPADAVEAIRIRGQYGTNGSRAFWLSTYLRGLSGYAYSRLIADVRRARCSS